MNDIPIKLRFIVKNTILKIQMQWRKMKWPKTFIFGLFQALFNSFRTAGNSFDWEKDIPWCLLLHQILSGVRTKRQLYF